MRVDLSKLYPVYAFDTACFYTDEETALDTRLKELRHTLAEKQKEGVDPSEKSELTSAIGATKAELKDLIDKNKDTVRSVRSEAARNSNIVQVFESTLVRELHMTPDEVNPAMIIVKVYYFGVAESIIKNGFNFNGKHYVFFSASAGQIRTKKFVAIQEDLLNACMDTLTCGLSLDAINAQGGVNVNKYLAYLALCNSATEVWQSFNIDRCIVIDDFETVVTGLVDFIDEKDFSITRRIEGVPITHTDGCGMVLPSVSKKNFMVRAPWVKGLLSPFPFDKFIREANVNEPTVNHALIKDVWGQEHDVLAENINVIFCKSQMKMWKYYSSWDEYKTKFKQYRCTAGKCNTEPTLIKKSAINYQMLQTLTTMTDEEIEELCQKTNITLSNMSCDRETMLRMLGVRKDARHLDYTQMCLKAYPALLRDEYFKSQLRDKKKSIEHDGRAGKLMIDGKFTFLVPDLVACCEHWFCGVETPEGALSGTEVYTREYPDKTKLDVLRSPHLYKEHTVRENVYDRKPELRKWFATNAIYTSTHDLITKILQFDVDGDRALVVAEPVIIKAAERECADVVPLYYPMAKAPAHELTPTVMYNGMVAAWTGGNIGAISNTISKIWAMDGPDADAVKVLCMENNFVIDYAKTLYKPTRPDEWNERLKKVESKKLPAFFKYAKDKKPEQVTRRGKGVIDRIYDHIRTYRFKWSDKSIPRFDYHMLMFNPNRPYGEKEDAIVLAFREAASALQFARGVSFSDEENHNFYEIKKLQKHMEQFGRRRDVCDILIRGLFDKRKTSHKAAFWLCFNDVVYDNLMANLKEKKAKEQEPADDLVQKTCSECGSTFMGRESDDETICPACRAFGQVGSVRRCIDCGMLLPPRTGRGQPTVRCEQCRLDYRRSYKAQKARLYRTK